MSKRKKTTPGKEEHENTITYIGITKNPKTDKAKQRKQAVILFNVCLFLLELLIVHMLPSSAIADSCRNIILSDLFASIIPR